MKKRFFSIFLILFVLVNLTQAQDLADIEQVDVLITENKVDEAKALLDKHFANDAKSYDVLWRMSRMEILLGEQMAGESGEKAYYERALDYANKAVKANKKGTLGYVRRAAANGKLALFQGVLTSNSYVNAIHDDCKKAIKNNADGDYHLATAYYILGRTHLKLQETAVVLRMPLDLDWGNLDEALEYLEKASELRPTFLMYKLDYARALIEDKKKDEAKVLLAEIADMDFQEPGDDTRKQEAADLLGSMR